MKKGQRFIHPTWLYGSGTGEWEGKRAIVEVTRVSSHGWIYYRVVFNPGTETEKLGSAWRVKVTSTKAWKEVTK